MLRECTDFVYNFICVNLDVLTENGTKGTAYVAVISKKAARTKAPAYLFILNQNFQTLLTFEKGEYISFFLLNYYVCNKYCFK